MCIRDRFISHLNVHHQVPVVHGPMIFNFQESSKTSLSMLFSGLKGKHKVIKISSHNLNREGEVESQIIGGNLSILCSLLGSKSFPSLENKILFIKEEIDENSLSGLVEEISRKTYNRNFSLKPELLIHISLI